MLDLHSAAQELRAAYAALDAADPNDARAVDIAIYRIAAAHERIDCELVAARKKMVEQS